MTQRALRGINLGGWLVLERWMTPDVFDGVKGGAEIDLVRELGLSIAATRLARHRDTFVTGKDFAWIAAHGFDFVRLPVGYWLFEQTQDFVDGEKYVKHAFQWAENAGLGIILDFHGVPGSQNGHDHSGQIGGVGMYKIRNMRHALAALKYMAVTYGQHRSLIGIELVNEPKVNRCVWRLLRYYDRACAAVAPHLREGVVIVVSDAFQPLRLAKKLSRRAYVSRLVLDVHLYQVFSDADRARTFDDHVVVAHDDWRRLLKELGRYMPVLVGEWSAALPSQAYDLSVGGEAACVSHYYQAQHETFGALAWAHCYWSYKAPGCGVWDWRASRQLLEDKL